MRFTVSPHFVQTGCIKAAPGRAAAMKKPRPAAPDGADLASKPCVFYAAFFVSVVVSSSSALSRSTLSTAATSRTMRSSADS